MPGRRHIIRILYRKEVNVPMVRRTQTEIGEMETNSCVFLSLCFMADRQKEDVIY